MNIYLATKIELKTDRVENVGVFSSKEKAQSIVKNKDTDDCEHEITKFS